MSPITFILSAMKSADRARSFDTLIKVSGISESIFIAPLHVKPWPFGCRVLGLSGDRIRWPHASAGPARQFLSALHTLPRSAGLYGVGPLAFGSPGSVPRRDGERNEFY